VKLVDANILIYAVNSDSAHHERAKRWLESALSGTDPVGMPWIVVLAFLRVTTRRGILERPLSVDDAVAYVDSWLQQPPVELVLPGPNHWAILRTLITVSGTAGNLTSDAHLAALALEGGWTLVSTDNDFRRFSDMKLLNPLSA
jgi:Predicted nucleic acid-binding protein, contains PIN domain